MQYANEFDQKYGLGLRVLKKIVQLCEGGINLQGYKKEDCYNIMFQHAVDGTKFSEWMTNVHIADID